MPCEINYTELDFNENRTRWNNLLKNSINSSYRASIDYEYLRSSGSKEIRTFIFHCNEEDLAGAHYSIKKYLKGIIKVAEISSGVLFREEPDPILLNFILNHFLSWAKGKKVSYVRLNPWLPAFIDGKEGSYLHLFNNVFHKHKFKALNTGRSTYWINLNLSEEEILKNIKRKTRYDIKLGIKAKISIKCIENPDIKIIDQFWDYYCLLGNNKGFYILKEKQFKNEVNLILASGLAILFVASYKDEIVNISMASKIGIASYLYGAINPHFKKLVGCPSPGHLAQWEMIRKMKSLGLKIYDLGFCPGPIPDKNHPSYSIWRFKYNFGGQYIQFMPIYGKVIQKVRGRLFEWIKY